MEAQANPLAQLTCLVAFGGEQGDRKALLPLFPCLAHDVGRRLPQPKGRAFAPVGLVAIWDTLGVERPRHTLAADSQGFLQELGKVLSNVGKGEGCGLAGLKCRKFVELYRRPGIRLMFVSIRRNGGASRGELQAPIVGTRTNLRLENA